VESQPNAGPVVAYLTSQYARASDTFIRDEVAQLRRMGFTVHTFSVRKPPGSEQLSPAIQAERARTEDLLSVGPIGLAASTAVMAFTRPGPFARAAKLALKAGSPGLKGRLWPLAYLAEAAQLGRRLVAKRVVHLHNHMGRNSAAVAMLASALTGIPYSMTVHGPSEFDLPYELALREKIGRSAFTLAISDFGRSQLMRWCRPTDWDKIHVVHCGLDAAFLGAEVTPVPDVPTVVNIGRLVPEKGQLLLVQAVAKLAAEGVAVELVLIGDGPMRKPIESAIERSGVGDRVRLAGWQTSEQIRDALRASRGMVMASFAEGLPVALMEAYALSRPVVSTTIAGVPELVRDGENGFLVPAGSVDGLADGIRRMATSPVARLTEMAAAGRQRVLERHDSIIEAGKIAALIQASLDRHAAHR
jgi:glycosyltransferase involved in cell wall biosynthesis